VAHSQIANNVPQSEALVDEINVWKRLADDAATRFGTPCYVSRWEPVRRMVASLERCFADIPVRSWLSFKTHPVSQLAREWMCSGRGVEVVSEAEFVAVRALGCPPAQLLLNGVAKHSWLPRHSTPQLHVHWDSPAEVTALLPLARANEWHVGLRCHVPHERDAREAAFGGQFGMSADEIGRASAQIRAAGVGVEGLHFHLGQGTRNATAYSESIAYLVALCQRWNVTPRYIDCGGGIDASSDVGSSIADLVSAVESAKREVPSLSEVWLENGSYLTRSSAALVVRVLDTKERPDSRYLICDGGRTNQALAADKGRHPLTTLPERSGRLTLTTIAGPTCMTDDRLARLMLPDGIVPGDLIVWLNAGAYHLPWETRFSHGLCAVVWADPADRLSLARARETPEQWRDSWTVSH
jgi:diaminopimelate decarboxylase